MTRTVHALLITAIVVTVLQQVDATENCVVELSRSTSPRNNYALVCKCTFTLAKSIFFIAAPSGDKDTVGASQATVQCIQHSHPKLTRWCNHLNSTQFERHARPVLNRCINRVKLSPQQMAAVQPFTFNRDDCFSKVTSTLTDNVRQRTISWVCECKQFDFYEVTPGWPRYLLKGDAVKRDFDKIESCAQQSTKQMQLVCTNNPSDYDILGLQILQTCCKRARVSSQSKFECAAVVP